VLFWLMEETEKKAQRAYTLNVSPGGLFVCTCYPSLQGSSVWVQLQELDSQPIKVLVTRSLAWGEAMRIPGFGGSFNELDPAVIAKLEKALKI
jgi:Tfp pilus assembly protein PilZ